MVICYSENMLNTDPREGIIYDIVNQLCILVVEVFIHFQKKMELCFGVISKTSPYSAAESSGTFCVTSHRDLNKTLKANIIA